MAELRENSRAGLPDSGKPSAGRREPLQSGVVQISAGLVAQGQNGPGVVQKEEHAALHVGPVNERRVKAGLQDEDQLLFGRAVGVLADADGKDQVFVAQRDKLPVGVGPVEKVHGLPGDAPAAVKAAVEHFLRIEAVIANGPAGVRRVEVDGADVLRADGDFLFQLIPDLPELHAAGGGHVLFGGNVQALVLVAELHPGGGQLQKGPVDLLDAEPQRFLRQGLLLVLDRVPEPDIKQVIQQQRQKRHQRHGDQ